MCSSFHLATSVGFSQQLYFTSPCASAGRQAVRGRRSAAAGGAPLDAPPSAALGGCRAGGALQGSGMVHPTRLLSEPRPSEPTVATRPSLAPPPPHLPPCRAAAAGCSLGCPARSGARWRRPAAAWCHRLLRRQGDRTPTGERLIEAGVSSTSVGVNSRRHRAQRTQQAATAGQAARQCGSPGLCPSIIILVTLQNNHRDGREPAKAAAGPAQDGASRFGRYTACCCLQRKKINSEQFVHACRRQSCLSRWRKLVPRSPA